VSMRTWAASALDNYYRDPLVVFLPKGASADGVGTASAAGYFITPHCDPDCCDAFGSVSTVDFGPFATAAKAREWSQTNLIEPAI
jgi:hypothetical protein